MISEIIVKQAIEGDDAAFSRLYETIYVQMYRMAYGMLHDKDDAEDAVSEAVVDMYRDICKLKKTDAFKAWAMRILWVKCKRKLKEYCDKTEELEEQSKLADRTDVEGQVTLRSDINKAMEQLTDEERMIVLSSSIAGLNSSQISEVTGLSKGTVRSKLSRALKKVRAGLEEYV